MNVSVTHSTVRETYGSAYRCPEVLPLDRAGGRGQPFLVADGYEDVWFYAGLLDDTLQRGTVARRSPS
jgi:hypothetical protein